MEKGDPSPLRSFTLEEGLGHGLEVKSGLVGAVKRWVWNAQPKDPIVDTPFLLLLQPVPFSQPPLPQRKNCSAFFLSKL